MTRSKGLGSSGLVSLPACGWGCLIWERCDLQLPGPPQQSQTFLLGPNQDNVATVPFLSWLWLTHWGQVLVASQAAFLPVIIKAPPLWGLQGSWASYSCSVSKSHSPLLTLVRDLEYWETFLRWASDSHHHVAPGMNPVPERRILSCQLWGVGVANARCTVDDTGWGSRSEVGGFSPVR